MGKSQILERNDEEIIDTKTKEEKNEDVKKSSRKKRKIIITSIIIALVLLVILVFSCVFAIINSNSSTIIEGIKINGIDVSGLTKEEANQKINEQITKILDEPVMLKYDSYEIGIDAKQIDAKYNVEEIVNQAYEMGRKSNVFANNSEILKTKFKEKEFNLSIQINDDLWNKTIEEINGNLPGGVEQSSYYIENNKLIITKGKQGVIVDSNALKPLILDKIELNSTNNDYIPIPTEILEPKSINIEEIYNEVHKEAEDAYISKDPFEIHPHVNGVDFGISIDDAKKLLEEDKEEYIIPLKVVKPAKTTDMLGEEAFPDRLATYSTTYNASNYNRSTNLRLSASKINGVILMPGEEFSYNKTLGQRTAAAGYKPAGAYVGGKVVNEYGGGICQTSSTLYNTVLLANLEVTSRTNHCYVSSYVPISRDATVSWGTLDFKFKNNRKNPIKIRASASNGVVKVDILGIKQDDDYEVVLDSKVVSSIKFSTQYEENSAVEEGKEKIIQNGLNGSIGEAYKILKKNGKVVSRTLISRDTYSAKPQIIQKGTKKKNNDNNNNNNNDENSNNSKSKNTENKNNENKNTSSVTIENVDMNSVKNEIKNNNKSN